MNAAYQLEQIAEFLNPLLKTFFKKYAKKPIVSAIDLGGGTGFTTNVLLVQQAALMFMVSTVLLIFSK